MFLQKELQINKKLKDKTIGSYLFYCHIYLHIMFVVLQLNYCRLKVFMIYSQRNQKDCTVFTHIKKDFYIKGVKNYEKQ